MPSGRCFLSLAAAFLAVSSLSADAQAPPAKPPAAGTPPGAAGTKPGAQKPPKVTPELARAAQLFQKAIDAQKAGHIGEAISLYKEVLKLAPGAYPARVNLGGLYMARGDTKSAAAAFEAAARIEPKNPYPHVQLANLYLNARRTQEARTEAEAAVKLDPGNAQAHFLLATIYAGTNDQAGAEREIRQTVKLAPGNPQAHFNLGVMLARRKQNAEAIAAFEQAVKLEPKMGQAHLYIGLLRQAAKEYRLAIPAFRRASELMPDNPAGFYDLGLACQLEGTSTHEERLLQESITAYVHALTLAPKYVPAHINVAKLYYNLGNFREAARHFLQAAALNPTDTRILGDAALAETWAANAERNQAERQALWQSAEAHYKTAMAKGPLPPLYTGMGYLYEQQGKPDLAAGVYEQWAKRYPKDAAAQIALGKAREGQRKFDEAVALYRKAIELDPKAAGDARKALARAYQAQNKPDQAAAIYKEMLAANPKDVEAHRLLAQFYMGQKKTPEALAEYEAIKKLAPKDTSPYVALGAYYERENRPDDALREYRAIGEMNPKDTTSHWYAARVLENQKKYDEAIAEYRAIEKVTPTDTFFVMNVPRLLELAGKNDEALAELRRLRDRDPNNVQFRSALATTLERRQMWPEAIAEYQAILAATPNATWAYVRIGDADQKLKRWDDARTAYMKALDGAGSEGDAYSKLQQVFDSQNKASEWPAFLQDRLKTHPADNVALSMYETACVRTKQQDQLIAFLKELAKGAGSREHGFLVAAASILTRYGKSDDALEVERQAARIAPDDFMTRMSIGARMQGLNRIPEAIGAYEEVVRIRTVPQTTLNDCRLKLGGLYEKNGQAAAAIGQYRDILKADPRNAAAAAALKRLAP